MAVITLLSSPITSRSRTCLIHRHCSDSFEIYQHRRWFHGHSSTIWGILQLLGGPWESIRHSAIQRHLTAAAFHKMFGPGGCQDQQNICNFYANDADCSAAENFCVSNVEEFWTTTLAGPRTTSGKWRQIPPRPPNL